MKSDSLRTAIVFGDGRLPGGQLTRATRDRLAFLTTAITADGFTHMIVSGGTRDRDRKSGKVLSEAFLMRRYLLSLVADPTKWLPRIHLEEDAVGAMNEVRETMTLVNRLELGQSPIIVIAQRLRLVHLRIAFRALGWGETVEFRECPTSWATEKPCVQALRIASAVIVPLGGAMMTLSSHCRNKLAALASPNARQ